MLIEVAATLAIVTLALHFAFPSVGFGTTAPRLAAIADAAASVLRDARTAAIASGRPVAARFDAAARRLTSGSIAVAIPPDVEASLTAGGNCPVRGGATEILFRPDGSNCGGVLRFRRGARTLSARVNWADGFVDVLAGE